MAKKNPAAVALAKRRMKTMTAEERSEVARLGAAAKNGKLTPEQRRESARKAGLASAKKKRTAAMQPGLPGMPKGLAPVPRKTARAQKSSQG